MEYVIKSGKMYLMDWIDIPVFGKQPQVNEDKKLAKRYTSKNKALMEASYFAKDAKVEEV
jgi:hypothetical protein